MVERLRILQSGKGEYKNTAMLSLAINTDNNLRKEIETLSKFFLHRTVSGCKNCYTDAYIELINYPVKKAMEQKQVLFELKRGKLLYDVRGEASKMLSQANITNSLALYHLKTNPSCEKHFSILPDNFHELVKNFDVETFTSKSVVKVDIKTVTSNNEMTGSDLYGKIIELVKAGSSQNAIYKQFKDIEKLDGKKMTSRILYDLIKKAKETAV